MFATLITDCGDPNALARVATRTTALLGCPVTTIPVVSSLDGAAELEAAGNLVDQLDAALGTKGWIIANVAPRTNAARQKTNGTHFCHFTVGATNVIATLDGATLALVRKLEIIETVKVYPLEDTMRYAMLFGKVTAKDAARIMGSQFRSFDFVPYLAHWLDNELVELTGKDFSVEPPDIGASIWHVDCFGNAKTTLLERDVLENETIVFNEQPLTRYARLKDVPNGEAGLIVGSSGYSNDRFLEIVVQGTSAARIFNLRVGIPIEIVTSV